MNNTKKFALPLMVILIFAGIVLLLSPNQFGGGYASLDDFREDHRDLYEGGNFLCSIDLDGRICDFVIVGSNLHIVSVRCKDHSGTIRYHEGESSRSPWLRSVEISMKDYRNKGKLPFSELLTDFDYSLHPSKKQLYWCIMEKTSINLPQGVESYPFEQNGQSYVLYIKTEER